MVLWKVFGPNVMHPCRFCTATSKNLQKEEVNVSDFARRCRSEHALHVNEAQNGNMSVFGVKFDCVFHKYLKTFHATTSLPPDISHDLLEGIVPFELALCMRTFIPKYFTLQWLNDVIKTFPYKFKDAVNKPQQIPPKFAVTCSVGGNATENWTLLRLLPIFIGKKIPSNEGAWELLMDLKDIVEISFAPVIHESVVGYLASKIADHKNV